MTSRGLAGIVVIVGGLLVALYIIVSILSGFGNVIGATYKYFLPAAFIFGAVAPRISMYVLLLCAVYIDFFKKLMAVDQNLAFLDIFFILGVPPVLLLGMCCGILAGVAQGRISFDKRLMKLFSLTTAIVAALSLSAILRLGANLGTLKELSNSAAFFGLLFALPVLFPKVEDVFRLLRFLVIIMVPAAFHGLYHAQYGLLGFEEEYMLSGLSMNMDFIYTGEGIYGPFASQGALAGAMSVAASICVFGILTPKWMMKDIKFPRRWICVALVILFMTAAVFSLKRFPLVVLPFTVIGFYLIRNKFGTVFAYTGALVGVVTLVAFSETLAANLPDWQQSLDRMVDSRSNDSRARLFQVRTFNTRLEDFSYLKDPENWEPFGVDWFQETEVGGHGVHSLVVKIFLWLGWVPLSGIVMCLIPLAAFLHTRLWRRVNTLGQRLFVHMTSLSISMFLAAGLGAAFFGTFPAPLFFGLFLGMAVTTGIMPPKEETAEESATAPEPQPVGPMRPRLVGRT